MSQLFHQMQNNTRYTLHEKCPYSELFWSTFPAFGLHNFEYGHFLIQKPSANKVYPETESISFSSPKSLDVFLENLKEIDNEMVIEKWKPKSCPYRLWRTYAHVSFIQSKQPWITIIRNLKKCSSKIYNKNMIHLVY